MKDSASHSNKSSHIAQEKTIVRKAVKNNFTVINNNILRNQSLSWKAKGILCYLLSLPDDWNLNLAQLQDQSIDGRDKLRTGIKELENAGYVKHTHVRLENGQFSHHEWMIYEEPITLPLTENPKTENPKMDNPQTENPQILSTKEKDKELKEIKECPASAGCSADAERLTDLFILRIRERKPDIKKINRENWICEMERLLRIDKRDPDKILRLIEWIHSHNFWRANILSVEKFRKQYDQIELQISSDKEKDLVRLNREYALKLKNKYPEQLKDLSFDEKYVMNRSVGKELPFTLPHETFKEAIVSLFGGEYVKR
jgi:hypothetical protein